MDGPTFFRDVRITDLELLDRMVTADDQTYERKFGNAFDGQADERLFSVGKHVLGASVEVVNFTKPGQPGYKYAEACRNLFRQSSHKTGPEPDDAIAPTPKAPNPNLTTGANAERPQQPL